MMSLMQDVGALIQTDSEQTATGVSRRRFLVGAAGTALYATAAEPVLAQAIQTDKGGLSEGRVSFKSGKDEVLAYRARPAARKHAPVVLVVSEIFGVHEYIQDVCRRWAKEGYYAIAPDLFERQGDPAAFGTAAEVIKNVVSKVPDAQVFDDLDATLAFALSEGADTHKAAVTGFCWGGRITWMYAAHNPAIKAGVAWYGRLVGETTALTPRHPVSQVERLNGPVLGLYGGADTGIPMSTVEQMQTALAKAGPLNPAAQKSEFVIYPDAPHAFHADYRPSYRPDAAKDAWRRAVEWMKAQGVK